MRRFIQNRLRMVRNVLQMEYFLGYVIVIIKMTGRKTEGFT